MQIGFPFDDSRSSAILSEDRKYRYLLSRQWADKGHTVGFICLNPSTADAETDDATVRKCIRFAKSWGGHRLLIGNLFAYRSTDPKGLKETDDPVGPENDAWLARIHKEADVLIAAWGVHGILNGRDQKVLGLFDSPLRALRLTKSGAPSHPLYLPETLEPFPFSRPLVT